jgi:hypothetical protein
MSLKERLLVYYIFPGGVLSLIFIIFILIEFFADRFGPFETIIAIAIALAVGLLIGGMLDFAANAYTPWRRKSIYNKSPFKELKDKGFELIDETHLEMQIDNFHYGVIWDGSFKPIISIMLLFKPEDFESEEAEMLKKTLKENDYKDIIVENGMLTISFEYNFFRPKYSKIEAAIKTLKRASIALNLQPISNLEISELWLKHMETKNNSKA